MEARFTCSRCQQLLEIPAEKLGARARCPACWAVLRVVGEDAQEVSSPAVKRTRRLRPAVSAAEVEQPPRPAEKPAPPRSSNAGSWKWVGTCLMLAGVLAGLVTKFIALGPPRARAVTWQELAPPHGGYSVRIPGVPMPHRPPGDAPGSEQFRISHPSRPMSFLVGYRKLPLDHGPPRNVLNGARKRFLQLNQGAVIVAENPVLLDGRYEGVEYEVNFQRARGMVRYFVAEDRLYLLLVAGPKVDPNTDEVRQFFDSFHLVERGGGG